MDRGAAVIAMAAVGGLIAVQPAINAGLGRATGNFAAALVSFAVGTVALAVLVAAVGEAGGVRAALEVEPIYLIGGLLGAVYVFTSLSLVGTIGAGGVTAATITGQLAAAVLLDRAGVLGLDQVSLSWDRLLGVALLVLGTYLVVR